MRGFITLSLLMASGVAVANENLVCEYAVGDFFFTSNSSH